MHEGAGCEQSCEIWGGGDRQIYVQCCWKANIYKYCLHLGSAWHDRTVPLSLCDMMVTHQSDGLVTPEKVESWSLLNKISSVEIRCSLFSLFVSYV